MAAKDWYTKILRLNKDEVSKTRQWLLDTGIVEKCTAPEHHHQNDNLTVSEKGARVFIELANFVPAETLAKMALERSLKDLLGDDDLGSLPPIVS